MGYQARPVGGSVGAGSGLLLLPLVYLACFILYLSLVWCVGPSVSSPLAFLYVFLDHSPLYQEKKAKRSIVYSNANTWMDLDNFDDSGLVTGADFDFLLVAMIKNHEHIATT